MDGRPSGFAGRRRVGEEDPIFARELLECDGYEGSDTAYDEDLGVLVVVLARRELIRGAKGRYQRNDVQHMVLGPEKEVGDI